MQYTGKRVCCTSLPEPIQESLEVIGGMEGLKRRLPPEEQLERESRIYTALSEPLRLKILHALSPQPLCVCVIREILQIADSRLSYHLNVLKKTGLIDSEQQGNWLIYRITEKGKRYI